MPKGSQGLSLQPISVEDILFKITCKHLHAADFKIRPLGKNQNVKFHLCQCKSAHSDIFPQMAWLSGEDQSFEALRAAAYCTLTLHQGQRELTVASFSMYSSGAPREARPISCNCTETESLAWLGSA